MGLWAIRWPNGDLSFVKAATRADACVILDQVGDGSDPNVQWLPISQAAIHLKLTDEGEFEYQEIDEDTAVKVMEQWYPAVWEEFGLESEKGERPRTPEDMVAAVKVERDRYGRVEEPEEVTP